jgi:hypothetical protein
MNITEGCTAHSLPEGVVRENLFIIFVLSALLLAIFLAGAIHGIFSRVLRARTAVFSWPSPQFLVLLVLQPNHVVSNIVLPKLHDSNVLVV